MVKLSAVGDVVHCLPVLAALKRHLPNSRIEWLVEESAAELLQGHPLLDRLWISHRKSWLSDIGKGRRKALLEAWRFATRLREQRFDLVLDLQGLYKSAVWTRWVRGKRKIGWSGTKELTGFSLTETIGPENFRLHAVDRYLDFIRYLGYDPGKPEFSIPIHREDEERVSMIVQEANPGNKDLISLNPVAKWHTKLWSQTSFARLADILMEELDVVLAFTGGLEDRTYVDAIRSEMKKNAMNLCGRTNLRELACLYGRSRLVLSTDTGPMHVAASVGTPVVALFGPTDPDRTGPYGAAHRVVCSDVECRPCFKRTCDHGSCMNLITPEQVFRAVTETLTSQ
ncbi:MAG: lipopolysaccharide heptosyltransferase II [Deltaproteobacteria bacterium]|nr:lipopolysaccharide heptosyltransferase II [Deltaproteobacteria bacterium]